MSKKKLIVQVGSPSANSFGQAVPLDACVALQFLLNGICPIKSVMKSYYKQAAWFNSPY